MATGETQELIVLVKKDNTIRYYVTEIKIFQILYDIDLKIGHGGRNFLLPSEYKL